MQTFDLIVLGGGSGGLAAAQRAAEYGARAAVFEPNRLGGTCVNVGCVPKKVMWYAGEIASGLEHAASYGFDVRVAGHDWAKLKAGRDAFVQRLNGIYQRNLERKDIAIVRSAGKFGAPHEIVAANGDLYRAEHVLIATGGYPKVPAVGGAELGLTSDGFFELEQLPRRVAIVGSGYVAAELGGVLNALGSETTLFLRHESMMRDLDALVSVRLTDQMRAAGVAIVTDTTVRRVTGAPGAITLHSVDETSFGPFDSLIWAIGRLPHSAALGL